MMAQKFPEEKKHIYVYWKSGAWLKLGNSILIVPRVDL